jgi:hypothetical protein
MCTLLFGIEHPFFPLACISQKEPSSQSIVLGILMSLCLSERIVKISKKPMLESRCTSGSSLLKYIMINYHHRSLGGGFGQPLLQVTLDILLHKDEVGQVITTYFLETSQQNDEIA